MENPTKALRTFEGIEQLLRAIIEETHSTDTVTEIIDKKGLPRTVTVKAIKKRSILYPKYVYPLHYLISKFVNEPMLYKEGVPLSRNEFAKRTGARRPVASLMLKALQEHNIIYRVKKASVQKRRGVVRSAKSSTYKFTEQYEKILEDEKVITVVFNRKEHGIMITNLCEIDQKYKDREASCNTGLYGSAITNNTVCETTEPVDFNFENTTVRSVPKSATPEEINALLNQVVSTNESEADAYFNAIIKDVEENGFAKYVTKKDKRPGILEAFRLQVDMDVDNGTITWDQWSKFIREIEPRVNKYYGINS